jgi:hypothetical protein
MPNEPKEQVITLTDGTQLIPLRPEEKGKLEAEIQEVLTKYSAKYLPVIQEEKTLTQSTQRAALFLLKIKSQDVVSPYTEDGEPTTEETPKAE